MIAATRNGAAWTSAAAALSLTALSLPAEAHHAPSSMPAESSSVTAFGGTELAALAVADAMYASLWLRLDGVVRQRLWLTARLPVYELTAPGHAAALGLGDMNGGAGVFLVREHDTHLLAAAELEMPTGDADRGLGNGHWMVHPFAVFRQAAGWFTLTAIGGDAIAITEHQEAAIRVDPHSDHELVYEAIALASFNERVSAGLRAGGSTVLEREDRWQTPLWAGVMALFELGERERIIATAQLPVTHARRFDAKFALTSALSF